MEQESVLLEIARRLRKTIAEQCSNLLHERKVSLIGTIGLIAEVKSRPLLVRHRRGTGVRKQIASGYHIGRKGKDVETHTLKHLCPLRDAIGNLELDCMINVRPRTNWKRLHRRKTVY